MIKFNYRGSDRVVRSVEITCICDGHEGAAVKKQDELWKWSDCLLRL